MNRGIVAREPSYYTGKVLYTLSCGHQIWREKTNKWGQESTIWCDVCALKQTGGGK